MEALAKLVSEEHLMVTVERFTGLYIAVTAIDEMAGSGRKGNVARALGELGRRFSGVLVAQIVAGYHRRSPEVSGQLKKEETTKAISVYLFWDKYTELERQRAAEIMQHSHLCTGILRRLTEQITIGGESSRPQNEEMVRQVADFFFAEMLEGLAEEASEAAVQL